jgi:hypothetical protein
MDRLQRSLDSWWSPFQNQILDETEHHDYSDRLLDLRGEADDGE